MVATGLAGDYHEPALLVVEGGQAGSPSDAIYIRTNPFGSPRQGHAGRNRPRVDTLSSTIEALMDVELLARVQFALTAAFHYLFPPLTIGLGVALVIMEVTWFRTGNMLYNHMARFWTRMFGLMFAIGVASGIVLEFEFGTNWATYSRYVGDIFGSALAAEGVFAFFLESGFLAILLFGWDRVKPTTHLIATILVCFGAHFSAVWIVVANSWQQTPAGYHIVGEGLDARAEITNFWEMLFNPSAMDRLVHTILGAWIAAAFLILSVSAYYLLKNRFREFATASMKIGLIMAAGATALQLASGDSSARIAAKYQPAKLAAMEGLYTTQPNAPLHLFGWVDTENGKVIGPAIPGLLSLLTHHDASKPVTGLDRFKPADRPPVQVTFQLFHLMVGLGMVMIAISWFGLFRWWRGTLFNTESRFSRMYLWLLVFAVLLPQIANQAGWFVAEIGRQPWIVYNLLRTSDGLSKAVSAQQVLFSLILFGCIYVLLFAMFIFLLDHKIRTGPGESGEDEVGAKRFVPGSETGEQ